MEGGRETPKKSSDPSWGRAGDELGTGRQSCKQEPREGAGMNRAANAPASSPLSGRGQQRGRGGGRGALASSPLFWNLPFSHPFQLPLSFPQSPGERETSPGFPPPSAHISQVRFKEIRLSREGRALGCPEPESPHS